MTEPRFLNGFRMSRPMPSRMRGFSLIELMISIVLGMLVVAAAGSIFVANKRTYRATESLARVQENSRLAFELMARDIREAAGSACDSTMVPANMLNTVSWWSDLPNGIKGYDNGTLTGSLAGTDAIQIVSATGGTYGINTMATSAGAIQTTTPHDFVTGDILLLCEFKCATVFQDTSSTSGTNQINHAAGTTVLPGNSLATLRCNANPAPAGDPTSHAYGINAVIGRIHASRWYIANNAAGTPSLYRAQVLLGVLQTGQEIVQGVSNMQLTYLVQAGTAYQTSTAIDAAAAWQNVVAVRINLTLQGSDKIGTNGAVLSRTLSNVVYIRNQKP